MNDMTMHTPQVGNPDRTEKGGGFLTRFGSRRSSRDTIDMLYGPDPEDSPVLDAEASSAPRAEAPRTAPSASSEGREVNVFTSGLIIEGNVSSETDLVIRGTVRGNISCRSNIEFSGDVTGDIEGKSIRINGGRVKGDIRCSGSLSVERSRIEGNLSASQARINNLIEGNITVQGTLSLQREANIQGSITASGLSVEEGAMMNGQITITREREEGELRRAGGGILPASGSVEPKGAPDSLSGTRTRSASVGRLPLADGEGERETNK